ncbi:MAG: copper-binding protein, partial [Pseudolabrys sp.]
MTFASHAELNIITLDGPAACAAGTHNGSLSITLSVIVALSIASAAYAQEALKGEVVTVDKASKKIGIKLSGTVGSSDATSPTPFKVQDARMFNVVKPGDKVSFTAERE